MAGDIAFHRDLDFAYGEVQQVSPLIRRVIARNGGPFTFRGTGTYIVGRGEVAVIDAGPALAEHVDALAEALAGETVTHLIVTHTHRDHSPATKPLQAKTGAPSYGFGPHAGGRQQPDVEEGADWDFTPDVTLADGDVIEGEGWTLQAVYTPGHTSNHLCFALQEEAALFSGDHVMGWSTTVVSPPDGDMAAYMASLEKLHARRETTFWPTHGPSIPAPRPFVGSLIAHRKAREAQIIECIERGLDTIPKMVAVMYADVDKVLHAAAARSVLAHLMHMVETGRVTCDGTPSENAVYRRPRAAR